MTDIEDGFGSIWTKCGPACDLVVVRPGKVQCEASDPACPDYGRCDWCGKEAALVNQWDKCGECEDDR